MAHWKVRALNEQGELTEEHATGTLADVAAAAPASTRAIVWVADEDSGTADAARGSSDINVDKQTLTVSDIGDVKTLIFSDTSKGE